MIIDLESPKHSQVPSNVVSALLVGGRRRRTRGIIPRRVVHLAYPSIFCSISFISLSIISYMKDRRTEVSNSFSASTNHSAALSSFVAASFTIPYCSAIALSSVFSLSLPQRLTERWTSLQFKYVNLVFVGVLTPLWAFVFYTNLLQIERLQVETVCYGEEPQCFMHKNMFISRRHLNMAILATVETVLIASIASTFFTSIARTSSKGERLPR
ncbi:hypothetical protein NLJ89_g1329 [Agrocybe chaxingu]|uniref:Uncharacterized protein n=1 Tax=Agrocybe chaxingu TaxID=84603 RepID=A0A9W8N0B1_9AGAR|nr:hypothetical protein NLJ89_g1329 [Agrocybe chaxingu]